MGEADSLRVAMVAGEASGDLLASLMLRGLRRQWPALQAAGVGGPRMVEQGFEAWAPSDRLSVFGYVDALARLPELLWLRRGVRRRVLRERPDVFVGIDAPDFNFGLETALRQGGVKTVHFVCPSIWAWRGERVNRLKAAADHVLCLFPFEPALLQAHGIAATYVGHPLADAIPLAVPQGPARATLSLAEEATVVALLPGSRRSEIEHVGPLMAQAALAMRRARPELVFVLPVAPGLRDRVEQAFAPLWATGALRLLEGQSHEALAGCDVAVVASGTATLETALLRKPMVIVYRMAELNWRRMRRMRYQPWVGLPNILSESFIVPELIQDDATPQAVAREALAWLDDPERVSAYGQRCEALHHRLRQDTGARACQALQELLHA